MSLVKVDYQDFSTHLSKFLGEIKHGNADDYFAFLVQNFYTYPDYAYRPQTLVTMKKISGSLTGEVQRRVIWGVAAIYESVFLPFPALSKDLGRLMCSYLSPRDRARAAQVSRDWKDLYGVSWNPYSVQGVIDWINSRPLCWQANNPDVTVYDSELPGYNNIREVLAFFTSNPLGGQQIVNLDLTYLELDAGGLLQEMNLLELLAYCPNLRWLNLSGCLNCDEGNTKKKLCFDSVLGNIRELLHLESLDLTGSREGITGAGLKQLAGLTSLRELRLDKCKLITRGLRFLGVLPALETLSISHTGFLGGSIEQLHEQFTKLKTLKMSRCKKIQTQDVSSLVPKNMGLQHFDISHNDWVTDDLIGTIVDKLPHLRSLNLWGINLAAESFQKLAKLSSLETLELGLIQEKATMNSILEILTTFPKLRNLHLSGCRIDDEGLWILATIPGLQVLILASCEGMSSLSTDGYPHGIPLLVSLEELRELNITTCKQVYEEDVEALKKAQQEKGINCVINWKKAW